MASPFSGDSAFFLGSKPQRASWSISSAVKDSLMIQPPAGSFQLAQRSVLAPHR